MAAKILLLPHGYIMEYTERHFHTLDPWGSCIYAKMKGFSACCGAEIIPLFSPPSPHLSIKSIRGHYIRGWKWEGGIQ
jgi:hypothetical protein